MSSRVSASAPGKIILFGEHAVVYGEPALGLAIAGEVKVELAPGRGRVTVRMAEGLGRPPPRGAGRSASPRELAACALGPLADRLDVEIELGVPPMAGLGSSAALAVALLRARAAHEGRRTRDRELLEEAIAVEDVAHGRSSGIDPAISLAGGLIAYRSRGRRIERVAIAAPIHVVVGTKGRHGGTRASVGGIAALAGTAPELVRGAMAALGACAREGRRALEQGEVALAGEAMDLAHGVLSGFGLVAEETEELVRLARRRGALGAKMSGAGGRGGAFVALAPDAGTARRIARALRERGALAWVQILPYSAAKLPYSRAEPA